MGALGPWNRPPWRCSGGGAAPRWAFLKNTVTVIASSHAMEDAVELSNGSKLQCFVAIIALPCIMNYV